MATIKEIGLRRAKEVAQEFETERLKPLTDLLEEVYARGFEYGFRIAIELAQEIMREDLRQELIKRASQNVDS